MNPQLKGMPALVRFAYLEYFFHACGEDRLRRWDGEKDRWGRRQAPIWLPLGSFFVQHRFDPADYFRLQSELAQREPHHSPLQLIAPHAEDRYKRYLAHVQFELELQRQRQLHAIEGEAAALARCGHEPRACWITALCDYYSIHASDLLRYCVAVHISPALSDDLFLAAVNEYMFKQGPYDLAWGDFIPQRLKDAAQQLRTEILQGGTVVRSGSSKCSSHSCPG